MANASVTAAVNRQTVIAAIKQARIEAAEHAAWVRAINNAAVDLEVSTWAFDGEVLRISSATTPGVRYTVTAAGCECRAGQQGKPCRHRAAHRLLCKAAELVTPAPRHTLTDAEMAAIVTELYG